MAGGNRGAAGTKRRIAMLSEHASPVALLGSEDAGGQNVYVDQVSRNLASLGFQVDLFTRRDSTELPDEVDWAHIFISRMGACLPYANAS